MFSSTTFTACRSGAYSVCLLLATLSVRAEAPEIVLDDYTTPTSLTCNGTHVFVAMQGSSPETCALIPMEHPVLVRVDTSNIADVDVLMSACGASIGHMVVAGDILYFRDANVNTIEWITVNGSNGPNTLVPGQTGQSGLAADDQYIYWIDRGTSTTRVRRAPLDGTGSASDIAEFNHEGYVPRGVAVDATRVFWVEGQIGAGRARRVDKGGGAVTTLADSSDGLDNTAFLAIDGTHLYFGGLADNRVERVAKTGGAVHDYVADWDASRQLIGIAVDDEFVIWTDTDAAYGGRVRRLEKSSPTVMDNEVTDLQILALGPDSTVVCNGAVYWGQHGQTLRTPVDSDGVALDLFPTHMEVTQCLQDLPDGPVAGSVPLVEHKATWVRVYPEVEYPDDLGHSVISVDGVTASLRGFRDGAELPESPLSPLTPRITVTQGRERRPVLERTFNFMLPDSWLEGTLALEAEVNSDGAVPETDIANNRIAYGVVFETPRPLCFVKVPVEVEDQTPRVNDIAMETILDFFEVMWPTGRFHRRSSDALREAGGSFELDADSWKILNKLEWRRKWEDVPAGWCESGLGATHFVGVTPDTDSPNLGFGPANYTVLWIKKRTGEPVISIPTRLYYEEVYGTLFVPPAAPCASGVLAHELGHNYGRPHVNCGLPEDDPNFDAGYPYNPATLSPPGPNSHWAFDPRQVGSPYTSQWTVLEPAVAGLRDYMSYCVVRWTSDYGYAAILDASGGIGGGLVTPPFQPFDWILTAGAVLAGPDPEHQELESEITGVHVLPGSFYSAAKLGELDELARRLLDDEGDWSLDLEGDGGILASHRFTPESQPSEHHGATSILLPVRWEPDAARVVIRHHDDIVLSRDVSPGVPAVRVLSPNGGEALALGLTVLWASSDPDNDRLLHEVHYSPDRGASWLVVAQDVAGSSYTLEDPASLPGSAGGALVRVVAGDGVRSAWDVSDGPFALEFRPPAPYINAPQPDAVLTWGDATVLRGGADDPEDGALFGESLLWFVDGEPVGSGERLAVEGLAPGLHTARLVAIDSHQLTGAATADFILVRRFCPIRDRRVELVYLMQVSERTAPFEEAFCRRLQHVVEKLEAFGLDVRSEMVALTGESFCSSRSVREIDPDTAVVSEDDWHHGIASLATRYDWGEGTRLIVPAITSLPPSPEGVGAGHFPNDGNFDFTKPDLIGPFGPIVQQGVRVVPWLAPIDGLPSESLRHVAGIVAAATGGDVVELAQDDVEIALVVHGVKARASCGPLIDGVRPSRPAFPGETVVIYGQDLCLGAIVEVGGEPAPSIERSGAGAWLRFEVPPLLAAGTYDVTVRCPDRPPVVVPAAIDVIEPPEPTDTDGDGVPDTLDPCPASDRSETIQIGYCLGQENIRVSPGCTLADVLASCEELEDPLQRRVCLEDRLAELEAAGRITADQAREWLACVRPTVNRFIRSVAYSDGGGPGSGELVVELELEAFAAGEPNLDISTRIDVAVGGVHRAEHPVSLVVDTSESDCRRIGPLLGVCTGSCGQLGSCGFPTLPWAPCICRHGLTANIPVELDDGDVVGLTLVPASGAVPDPVPDDDTFEWTYDAGGGCPIDTSEFAIFETCGVRVRNVVLADGCTVADHIDGCETLRGPEQVRACLRAVVEELPEGLVSPEDFAALEACLGPDGGETTRHGGFEHARLGAAETRSEDGALVVAGIGSSREDGVAIEFGAAESFGLCLDEALSAAEMPDRVFLGVEIVDAGGETIGIVEMTDEGDLLHIRIDYIVGSVEVIVLRDGEPVGGDASGMGMPVYDYDKDFAPECIRTAVVEGGACIMFCWPSLPVPVRIRLGDETVLGDCVMMLSRGGRQLDVGDIREIRLRFAGTGPRTIVDEDVVFFGNAHRGTGDVVLEPTAERTLVTRYGPDGGGVAVEPSGPATGVTLTWRPVVPAKTAGKGLLELGVVVDLVDPMVLPDAGVALTAVRVAGDAGGIMEIAADLSALGAATYSVQLLDAGDVVAELRGQSGPLVGLSAGEWPTGAGASGPRSGSPLADLSLGLSWNESRSVTLGEERGDELRFLPEIPSGRGAGGTGPVTVDALTIALSGFEEMVITGEDVVGLDRETLVFRRGDANVDGKVDISDGLRIVNRLFLGAPPFPCDDVADSNDDSVVDISDAIKVFGYLFLGASQPPAPGPFECGTDPTADDLDCAEAACL